MSQVILREPRARRSSCELIELQAELQPLRLENCIGVTLQGFSREMLQAVRYVRRKTVQSKQFQTIWLLSFVSTCCFRPSQHLNHPALALRQRQRPGNNTSVKGLPVNHFFFVAGPPAGNRAHAGNGMPGACQSSQRRLPTHVATLELT